MLTTHRVPFHRRCGGLIQRGIGAIPLLGVCALLIGVPAAAARGDEPAAKPSPLDNLDAAKIPAEERFDKQPKELVAVFGQRIPEGARNGVAFSPDGKLLASCRNGAGDKVVILWDTATAREAAVLRGHKLPVRSVAFSPDGKTLASAGGETPGGLPPGGGELRLWDLGGEKPKLKAELAGHTAIVTGVAFSPDGKTLGSVSADKTVRLWDLSGEKPAEKVKLPTGPFDYHSVAFSPDGKALATSEVLWDLGGEKPEKRAALFSSVYRGSGGSAVAFTPNGKNLVVGAGNERAVLVWGLGGAKLKEPVELEDAGSPVLSVAVAPDSRRLASAAGDGRVVLWDIEGKRLREWKLTRLAVTRVAFAPDGRHLAVASEKGVVYILRLSK
jgi:WD40 repeat protein